MTEKTSHIHKAMVSILKDLQVDKNGVLPGNMGGKTYITAHDAAAQVKALLVQNELYILPYEEVIENEHIIHKDRLNIRVLVRGQYEIVSSLDGSSVTVTGVGDGLATGTAVASNIGSTNALKNALLRTFLITEQSVEDMAQKDLANAEATPQGGPQGAIDKARKATKPKSPGGVTALRNKIRDEFITTEKFTSQEVTALRDKIKKEQGIEDAVELHEVLYKELSK